MCPHQVLQHASRLRSHNPADARMMLARPARRRLCVVAFRRAEQRAICRDLSHVCTGGGCAVGRKASLSCDESCSSSSNGTSSSGGGSSFDSSSSSGNGSPAYDPLEFGVRVLQRKNMSTQTLLLARDARIQLLLASFHSQGLEPPQEITAAAAAATAAAARVGCAAGDVEDIMLEQQHHSASLQELHRRLLARSTALSALGRAKNEQIRALEAALHEANVRLPRWRFDTTSSSSSAGSAAESSMDRPAVPETAPDLRVHFNIKCVTSPGDSLWLVGSHPALGSWSADDHHAFQLTWTPGHLWQGDLALNQLDDLLLSFKAVLRRGGSGQLQWQPGANREVVLGQLMGYDREPAVASMDFYGYEEELPLNYADACIKACKKLLGTRADCYTEAGARQAAEAAIDGLIWRARAQQQIAAQIRSATLTPA